MGLVICRYHNNLIVNMFSRTVSQRTLGEMVDPSLFQPRERVNQAGPVATRYRIPDHQRFPSWSQQKKQRLVESVMKNWPIHAIILTKHIRVNIHPETNQPTVDEYYDVEDGQTRLTCLQEFYLDKFATIDNELYSQLSLVEQNKFLAYQITTEVFNVNGNDAAVLDTMANIFERLNSGKPLGDNDKYYARNQTPVVRYAIDLSKHETMRVHFDRYIGSVASGKSRMLIGDMVGGILSIAYRTESHLNTSYERNYSSLTTALTANQMQSIDTFFGEYFAMLTRTVGAITTRPNKKYGRLSGIFGLAICSWIKHGHIHDAIEWYTTTKYYNPHYEPATFAELSIGDRRNCQGSAISNRLAKIIIQHQLNQDANGGILAPLAEDEDEEEYDDTDSMS